MSIVTTIRTRIIELLEGALDTDRPIPAGRFIHADEASAAIPEHDAAPFPFEIPVDGEWTQPLDVASTLSGAQVWGGKRLTIRVLYSEEAANRAHVSSEARVATIDDDYSAIRRTVGYPRSYDAIPGYAGSTIHEGRISRIVDQVEIDRGQLGAMLVLEVPVDLTYREDYS